MQASGQKQDDMQKPLFENKNAMAICTRNSKKAMKIGPQEKRFCFSRGPIFMHNFLRLFCNSPFLFGSFLGEFLFIQSAFPDSDKAIPLRKAAF